ncbi:hypothetical protein D9Q98_000113 [Chlorella vulgaris]|uniref:Integral membrane bound transporter domain-containing protein n=1 Tax=Chlorella vulgaris TaxID=3077 RepID=A0A9D4Z0U5_CHLVU|nr:hypothetical protein D9Q98_000113 [Chlorella vulgaris]
MGYITAFSILSKFEAWITGYKSEHYKLGLQQGTCQALALLPILVNKLFRSIDRGGSALFISLTVAVVLEPSTGDSFRKLVLRLLGAGVSAGIGMLLLYFAVGDSEYTFSESHQELAAWIVPGSAICSFVFACNQQRYWQHREFWSVALVTLPIVVVPAIRSTDRSFWYGACYRLMDVVIGIVLAAVVSFFVLPVRARDMLERHMASTLIKMGDLAVWLVGQACVPPAPGSSTPRSGDMPGRSGTDNQYLYTDDGLRARLQPLMATTNKLADDVSHMWRLLASANAELSFFPPRRFPTQQYKTLLHSCQVSLGLFYALLNSMQCGDVTLEICQQHIGDLSEAGVRLSAAFTALGTLICPLKAKKKGKQKKGKRLVWRGRKPQTAAADEAAGAAAAAERMQGGGVGLAAEQLAQYQGVPPRPQPGSPLDVERFGGDGVFESEGEEVEGDDPFAALEDEEHTGDGPSPVVALSPSDVMSAQQMARHLSQVMRLHGSNARRGGQEGSSVAGEEAAKLSAMAEQPDGNLKAGASGSSRSLTEGFNAAAAAGGPAAAAKPALVGTADGCSLRGAQQRDWALLKLQALVDAVEALEAACLRERAAHYNADGLPSFVLLVRALVNLTRQCGACFTALDEQRGATLHAYFNAARLAARANR